MSPNSSSAGPDRREHIKALTVLALVALATRGWLFGNPVIGIDEQFYLLAGERLRDGVLPYVDIWDRKPVGLFLIYAAGGTLFGDPVIGHQLLAALSAVLTGWVIFVCARRLVAFPAALAGAAPISPGCRYSPGSAGNRRCSTTCRWLWLRPCCWVSSRITPSA